MGFQKENLADGIEGSCPHRGQVMVLDREDKELKL
ncbi:Hypothetical protein Minf_1603 [Methylacidiphilum infernorum V4]|uniref:Uncharacterized protein n=1 Tax=Methylacidiphilum infernorum (isolate V4) TaxID=481448 RepID=B3DWF4_METI4|nr:Hypothetical protein Minf_1603 [Methylacidiphilum infernorum V4]